ncbi:hypothetical protein FV222_14440 [Methylobacterium sp. WL103]|uniref:hypothetical protein n=1 Tax=Methylobacterium sp. WL103 TaxID=2603891 RepID=UPI0011C9E935|nr:hypothetical protein [Methylobacterium sp. WL103]TXM98432.1 hypothetical protein FV222_14440 [Methylobacterium sp. WL103]
MRDTRHAFVGRHMAPLNAARRSERGTATGPDLSRHGRLAACLVALALPTFAIVAAETAHRVAPSGATQAAASGSPSRRAAAFDGVSRAGSPVWETLLTLHRDTIR